MASKRALKERALVSGMHAVAEARLLRRRRMTRKQRIAEDVAAGIRPPAPVYNYHHDRSQPRRKVRRSPSFGKRIAHALAEKVQKVKKALRKEDPDGGA